MIWVRETVELHVGDGELLICHTWFNRSRSNVPSGWVMVVGFHRYTPGQWEIANQFSKFAPIGQPDRIRRSSKLGDWEYEKKVDEGENTSGYPA